MRGSILSRPLRPPSRINAETMDVEFQKEQQLLEARRQKYQSTEEYMQKMRLSDKPDVDTKLKLFDENKQQYVAHQTHAKDIALEQRSRAEHVQQALLTREMEEEARAQEQKRRKMEEARRTMEENRRLADERQRRMKEMKEHDHALDRQNIRVLDENFSQRRLR